MHKKTAANINKNKNDNQTLIDIENESKNLQNELLKLKSEKKLLREQLSMLEEESRLIDDAEEKFFRDANDFWHNIDNLSNEHGAVRQKIRDISQHLEIMKRTNVFDDAFHIYHDGHFGTINGLRLGKLPSVMVDWEEINAGLGQALLLLDVLTQRCKGFQFKGYELHPMGSFSFIRARNKDNKGNSDHQMYGSSGLFGYKQCDKALECFLNCIQQFSDWIRKEKDSNFALKYQLLFFLFFFSYIHIYITCTKKKNRIKDHEIGNPNSKKWVSIRFSQHSEEEWTTALKYMIIDLKYILAWVARSTQ